jgi:glutathione S-transferase
MVTSGIQPLQNLSVLRQVKQVEITGTNELVDSRAYAKHVIDQGLEAVESVVASCGVSTPSKRKRVCYAAGTDYPTIADLAIIPQLYNATRFGIDISKYPTLFALNELCNSHAAFQQSKPEAQPDMPSTA